MDIDFKWLLRGEEGWDHGYDKSDEVYISSGKPRDGWCRGAGDCAIVGLLDSRFCVAWWADNTFELLSRDEEERRLFATLLELER